MEDPDFDSFAAVSGSGSDAVFAVNLPRGDYVVEAVIADGQFRFTPRLFLGDRLWIDEPVTPAGQVVARRAEVSVGGERLTVGIPSTGPSAPFANLARLTIYPAGTPLDAPPEERERPALTAADIAQPDLADTPVIESEGREAPLADLVQAASPPLLLGDPGRPGMWCWFQDPRVVVDTSDPDRPILLAGVVTFAPVGSPDRGDVDLYWADLSSVEDGLSRRGRVELDDRLQMDDHASPGLLIRPDGRYLATWTMHGDHGSPTYAVTDRESVNMRWRISKRPGDPTEWGPLQKDDVTRGGLCYTHPFYLPEADGGKGLVFNATRSLGFDSHVLRSTDLGETWEHVGRLMDAPDPWPVHGNGGRAYVKYAGDGGKRVYILVSDDHPDVNFNKERTGRGPHLNSIYAGYIEDDRLFRMDGTMVDANLDNEFGTPPTDLTVLLKDGTEVDGALMRRGWQNDIRVGPDGWPVAIFQFRADDDVERHHYFYARFDGERFPVYHLAHAGANFGRDDQPDYTGLATVDPMNPETVYISTNRHPVTGELLVSEASGEDQFEIYMGRTPDGGATWYWAAVTENSAADNLRPYAPAWETDRSAVVWLQGNYPAFYVYDTEVMLRTFELN